MHVRSKLLTIATGGSPNGLRIGTGAIKCEVIFALETIGISAD